MKTGTSGSVSSMTPAETEVDRCDQRPAPPPERLRRARAAAGSGRTLPRARRCRPLRLSRPRRSPRRRGPPAGPGASAPRGRVAAARARRSPRAGPRPRTPTRLPRARRRPRPGARAGRHVCERGTTERPGGDVGEQHGLRQDEQRREHAERGVERQQDTDGARSAQQPRVERGHAPSSLRSSARPGRSGCRRPPRRAARGRRGTSTPGRAGRPGGALPRRPSSR